MLKLSFLGSDKVQHAVTGTVLGIVACGACFAFGWSLHWGMLVVAVAGLGKELIDLNGYGTPEWQDAYCTICGGALGYYLVSTIQHII